MKTERPTPETDAHYDDIKHFRPQSETIELLRKLERQRDELLETLRDVVALHDFQYLNSGIGTATHEGRTWLRARTHVTLLDKVLKGTQQP